METPLCPHFMPTVAVEGAQQAVQQSLTCAANTQLQLVEDEIIEFKGATWSQRSLFAPLTGNMMKRHKTQNAAD